MTYIGIDISKDSFVAAFPRENAKSFTCNTFVYKNSPTGIRTFIQRLSADQHHCVMEATGNYSFLLLYLLDKAGIPASLINPKQIKSHARTVLSTVKSDPKDAEIIAHYGYTWQPAVYKMPSETILLLKQKRAILRQLKKQLLANENLQESLKVLPFNDPTAMKALKNTIAFLSRQIRHIEEEMVTLTAKEYKHQLNLLTSIKGIGLTVATALIIGTGGFQHFDNAKQISKYIGLSPTYQQSGTSVNIRGSINRNGDAYLRGQLYTATWSAIKHNTACKELYLRLKANGKPGKVALVAVANKLIRQAWAVIQHDTPYIDGFISTKP